MEDHKPESLAGQKAIIKVSEDEKFTATFGPDVYLTWANGVCLSSNEVPVLYPEIRGRLKADNDYSHIQDAELILDDRGVFKISFHDSTYFFAHKSINSRNRVY